MKKSLILIILLLIFPVVVNAESKYLYDVLKNEAESNRLAREYTGEHHDSFTEEPSKKIYHWFASSGPGNNTAFQVKNKWNVVFGDFCWQMIRTTDTGGVKLLYNGVSNNGRCNNTGTDQSIGKSKYNSGSSSLGYAGYMYNEIYNVKKIHQEKYETVYKDGGLSTEYWYADSVNWNSSTNKFELINPYKVSSANEYVNLAGKYTFSSKNETQTSQEVQYIVGVVNQRYFYLYLKNGQTTSDLNNTYTYGYSYTYNSSNNTYTIDNPTTITELEYFNNYRNIGEKYICKNAINDSCDVLWHADFGPNYEDFSYADSTTTYKFSNGFSYDTTTNKYTLNNDSVFTWDTFGYYNKTDLSNYHYTCYNLEGECTNLSYLYYSNSSTNLVLEITDGKSIEDTMNEMLYNDDVNTNNSIIKTYIDDWYNNNLIDYTSYLEDTIYCNDRSQSNSNTNGWNPNGGNLQTQISFGIKDTLNCSNDTDKFSLSNPKAQLTHPIGLMTINEANLLGDKELKKTQQKYWLSSPSSYVDTSGINSSVFTDDFIQIFPVNTYDVRPVISLKSGTKYISGNGSKDQPYTIDYTKYYRIDVEINNETEDLTVEIDDLSQVPEGETVNFKVTPIKGRKLTSIKIVDEDNNEIDYTTTDNKNYTFTMPSSDVTIKPSYERVKNAVNVEDNKNTKEFVIEVNDATAVVYEDTVRFKVEPKDGYEVENIEITDEGNNKISYKKTSNKNEYEFIMPDTDVLIKPYYRLIPTNSIPNNPNTKRQILLIVISVIILSIMTLLYVKKKKRLN